MGKDCMTWPDRENVLRVAGTALQGESRHRRLFLPCCEGHIALPRQREVFSGNAAFIMGGERQRHLVETNVDIRMMLHFLRALRDAIDKMYALQESLKLKGTNKCLRALRPMRDHFPEKSHLLGREG
jgi:hypothetical protein